MYYFIYMFQCFFRFLILVIENITELIIVISFLLAAIDMLLRRINILSNTTKKKEYIKLKHKRKNYHIVPGKSSFF